MYITHCDVQNAKHNINTSALMQPPFKFWFLADSYEHLIPVPKELMILSVA
jgi:hypothetical protein